MSVRAEFDGDRQMRFEGLKELGSYGDFWVPYVIAKKKSPGLISVQDAQTEAIKKIFLEKKDFFDSLSMPLLDAPAWREKLPKMITLYKKFYRTVQKIVGFTENVWGNYSIKPLSKEDIPKFAGIITWAVLFSEKGDYLHIKREVFQTVVGFYLFGIKKGENCSVFLDLKQEAVLEERKSNEVGKNAPKQKKNEEEISSILHLSDDPVGLFELYRSISDHRTVYMLLDQKGQKESARLFLEGLSKVSTIETALGIGKKSVKGLKRLTRLTAPIGHVRKSATLKAPLNSSPPKAALAGRRTTSLDLTEKRPIPAANKALPLSPKAPLRGRRAQESHSAFSPVKRALSATGTTKRSAAASPPPKKPHPTSPKSPLRGLRDRRREDISYRKRSMSARGKPNRSDAASPTSPSSPSFRKPLNLNPLAVRSGVMRKLDERSPPDSPPRIGMPYKRQPPQLDPVLMPLDEPDDIARLMVDVNMEFLELD